MNNNIPRSYIGTNNCVYDIGNHRVHYDLGNNKVNYNKNNQVLFYYPKAEQFPFDDVTKKIVLALEKHNWQFPQINVTFDDIQIKNTIYRNVWNISTPFFKNKSDLDFSMYFGREQGTLAYGADHYAYRDRAAISSIRIPGKKLEVYEDGSGPSLEVDSHVYSGRLDMPGNPKANYHQNWNSPYLNYVRENYLETKIFYFGGTNRMESKDYPKKNVEPGYYKTDEIFQEFKTYLEEHVLKVIEEKN